MAEEQRVGIIRAIFRYFRFWNWRKARGIVQAADEQFTGSVDGIDAAFEMHRDTMIQRFTGLRDAISEVESHDTMDGSAEVILQHLTAGRALYTWVLSCYAIASRQ